MSKSSSSSMRASVITAPGKAEVVEVPRPTPSRRQILVKVLACGVCASNLPRWEGREWFSYPSAPGEMGHEAVGEVVDTGSEVSRWKAGDRVAILSNHAYAEYDVAGEYEAVNHIHSSAYLPGEPLGCAWNIFYRAQVSRDSTVAVIGGGFLGTLLMQLCLNAGATVYAIVRRQPEPSIAATVEGVHWIVDHERWRIAERIKLETNDAFCQVVFEAAGHQETLDLATEITGERGRMIIAGYHQDGPRSVNMQLWNWRGIDVINAHERDSSIYIDGMAAAYRAVEQSILRPLPLITHQLPLERLSEALDLARQRPAGFMKAIIHP